MNFLERDTPSLSGTLFVSVDFNAFHLTKIAISGPWKAVLVSLSRGLSLGLLNGPHFQH